MKKIYIIEVILYIVATIISVLYFKSSIAVMMVLFCFASIMLTKRGEKYKTDKKYKIIKYICILGFVLIVLGHIILQNDFILVIGTFIFSVTLAPMIVKDFLEYAKRKEE